MAARCGLNKTIHKVCSHFSILFTINKVMHYVLGKIALVPSDTVS